MLDLRRKLPHTPFAAEKAKELRRNMTIAEAMLWRELKGRLMRGYDFHRQTPIGDYIVDLFCPRLMLAVEIDGDSHRGREHRDAERQEIIERQGVRFLRFDDLEVRHNLEGVVRAIEGWIVAEEGRDAANRPPPLE